MIGGVGGGGVGYVITNEKNAKGDCVGDGNVIG